MAYEQPQIDLATVDNSIYPSRDIVWAVLRHAKDTNKRYLRVACVNALKHGSLWAYLCVAEEIEDIQQQARDEWEKQNVGD